MISSETIRHYALRIKVLIYCGERLKKTNDVVNGCAGGWLKLLVVILMNLYWHNSHLIFTYCSLFDIQNYYTLRVVYVALFILQNHH
jgi:hypothetical protein